MTFQQETVDHWIEDARPLIYEHWQELGLDLDLKIAPDIEKMRAMEKLGMWVVLTAREGGSLAGYLLAVVSTHLHYATSPKMFIVDAYYIRPFYRQGTGAKLLKFAQVMAKHMGCIKIYLSCKVHKDHSALFSALGYRLTDYAFTKRI